MYRVADEIYLVVESTRNPGQRFAKRLVVSPPRMTKDGETVNFDYVYARGVIWLLTPADRMSEADLRSFMIKYGKCVKCGHKLKAAKTIESSIELGQMVGKVCAKKMGLLR